MKRILKLLFSLAVYLADAARATVGTLLGKPAPGTCTVLYYHEVVTADRQRFADQLDVILHAAQPVSALDLPALSPGKKHVAITVDDAFVSFFSNGLPEIEKRKIPVLVFVPTAWIGKVVDWAMEEVMASPNEKVATLAELKEYVRHPLISVGSHTVNHRKLTLLNDAEALQELAGSKEFLERELHRPITTISFPYGGCSPRDATLATQCGYRTLFTTRPARVGGHRGEGLVGRFRIDPSDWMLEVKLKASGAYRWQSKLQQWRARVGSHPACQDAKTSAICSA